MPTNMNKTLSLLLISAFYVSFSACLKQGMVVAEKTNGALVVSIAEKPVLSYQYATIYPPQGIDSAFQRSGFIHPLKTLNGHVLTRIQPEDHYHHYGIWNPWTHVLFEGDTLDFWNLKKKEGTVRFANFEYITNEANSTEFKVLHEHVVLKNGEEKVALNEWQTNKITPRANDYYIVDFNFEYSCATDNPFKILEYRYAGFCWRATEEWDKNNSEIITSEGKTRLNADSTPGRWCKVQGELGDDYGGALIMSHPDNYNHPEPLRIWPIDQDDRGNVFVNFSPTKTKDWLLEPKQKYFLKYRLLVFNNKMSAEEAEGYWNEYVSN